MATPNEEEMATMTNTNTNDSTKQGLRTLVILLYTLAVMSVGVTGLIIPMNLFYCDYGNNYGYFDNNNYIWNTNTSSFSNDVQNWYNDIQKGSSSSNSANFAIIPSNGILLFTGKDTTTSSYDDFVYSYNGTSIKKLSYFKNPSSFVVTTDNTSICMSGYYYKNNEDTDENDYTNIESSSTIACYDGTTSTNLRFITNYENISPNENHNYKDFYNPSHLYSSTNNTIWFVATSKNYYAYKSPVFSLNGQTMALTLHSTLIKQGTNGKDTVMDMSTPTTCDVYKMRRNRALISIFSSILPTFITAIILMKKIDFIPTMHIIIYISITAFIVSLILSIQPNFNYMDLVLKYWLCITNGIWMSFMIITFGILSSPRKRNDNKRFGWNINFTTILFFFAMSWSLGIPVPYYDSWWRWVLVNFIVYIPYIFFGVVIENILLVLLGAIGIFNDVWRFSNAVANHIDSDFQIIIQVILFAGIGTFVLFLGWKINQYQEAVQGFVRVWVDRNLGFFISRRNNNDNNDGGSDEQVEENDGVHTAVTIL